MLSKKNPFPNNIFIIIIQLSNVALYFKLQKAGHYIASGQNCVSQSQ